MSALSDLAVIWSVILAFAIYAYVILDGFDLGVGILFIGLARLIWRLGVRSYSGASA